MGIYIEEIRKWVNRYIAMALFKVVTFIIKVIIILAALAIPTATIMYLINTF